MGFARKLGFCLKPTRLFGKRFPGKSDPMMDPLIFVPFAMNFSSFSFSKFIQECFLLKCQFVRDSDNVTSLNIPKQIESNNQQYSN